MTLESSNQIVTSGATYKQMKIIEAMTQLLYIYAVTTDRPRGSTLCSRTMKWIYQSGTKQQLCFLLKSCKLVIFFSLKPRTQAEESYDPPSQTDSPLSNFVIRCDLNKMYRRIASYILSVVRNAPVSRRNAILNRKCSKLSTGSQMLRIVD